jgi:ABC-2 type transport system ATP-binding protein
MVADRGCQPGVSHGHRADTGDPVHRFPDGYATPIGKDPHLDSGTGRAGRRSAGPARIRGAAARPDGGHAVTAAIEATGLGLRYGRRWALSDCTLAIPAGQVAGLVGRNGAGKTTLLHLAAGLRRPTAGTISVLGGRPAGDAAQLGRVGFVAQDTPAYRGLSVAGHLRMGQALNPGWDGALARRRVGQLGLDPRQRAGRLSGGQRAQLALTLALAKRPDLLILDEPAASLDPLARREFLAAVAAAAAEHGLTVVLSSHLMADVERICDYLILLVASRVALAGPVSALLAAHGELAAAPHQPVSLDDLVIAYLGERPPGGGAGAGASR